MSPTRKTRRRRRRTQLRLLLPRPFPLCPHEQQREEREVLRRSSPLSAAGLPGSRGGQLERRSQQASAAAERASRPWSTAAAVPARLRCSSSSSVLLLKLVLPLLRGSRLRLRSEEQETKSRMSMVLSVAHDVPRSPRREQRLLPGGSATFNTPRSPRQLRLYSTTLL